MTNAHVVNLLADVKDGCFDPASDPGDKAVDFLRRMEILDAGPEVSPATSFSSNPMLTSVTFS